MQLKEKACSTAGALERLYELAKKLRFPGGCPWDAAQTPDSMCQYIIEECFETVDSLTRRDAENSREELGDLLYNVMLTAVMFEQAGTFSVADVANDVCEKLIRRHPHVFPPSSLKTEPDPELNGAEQKSPGLEKVNAQWERIKENVEQRKKDSVLDEVPQGFPPLLKARKYLAKAAKRGFEWPDSSGARAKLGEELCELDEAAELLKKALDGSPPHSPAVPPAALAPAEFAHAQEETGDLLLALVNFARMNGIDAVTAMECANKKFYSRFTHVEQEMRAHGVPMDCEHRRQMLEFWNQAKSME